MPHINSQLTQDPVGFLTRQAIAIDYTGCVPGINQCVLESFGAGVVLILRLKTAVDATGFSAYFLPYADG